MTSATFPALSPRAFAPGAIYAYADATDDLRWALTVARGDEEIRRALSRRSEDREEILLAAHGDGRWFAETRAGDESGWLSVAQDERGAITRAVSFRCAAVEPPRASAGEQPTTWPDARVVLEGYFSELRAARFDDAAAQFTPDCFYTHPPYPGGSERVRYRGRDALARGFVVDRGPTPAIQVVTRFVQDGPHAFVEGQVDGIPDGGTWGSALTLAPDGLIRRYVSFYGSPRVPQDL